MKSEATSAAKLLRLVPRAHSRAPWAERVQWGGAARAQGRVGRGIWGRGMGREELAVVAVPEGRRSRLAGAKSAAADAAPGSERKDPGAPAGHRRKAPEAASVGGIPAGRTQQKLLRCPVGAWPVRRRNRAPRPLSRACPRLISCGVPPGRGGCFFGEKSSGIKAVAAPGISHSLCSAGFQACCIAGFKTRGASGEAGTLATWKSATQQVWKPALQGGRVPRLRWHCEVSNPTLLWRRVEPFLLQRLLDGFVEILLELLRA